MASADERLHDLVCHARCAEEVERHGGQQLQRGYGAALAGQGGVARDRLRRRPDVREQAGELLAGDRIRPDADALDYRVQVGRSEQTDTQSGTVQDGGEHGGGGALAVGAGDVDRGHGQVRVVQLAQQGAHALRAVAVALARRAGAAQIGQPHQSFNRRLEGPAARHGGIVDARRIGCKDGRKNGCAPGGGPW